METAETFTNDVCPITLDELAHKDPRHIFVHREVGMDVYALYEYLLQSLYFTNPVNRIPFEMAELGALENRIKDLHGPHAIVGDDASTLADALLVHVPADNAADGPAPPATAATTPVSPPGTPEAASAAASAAPVSAPGGVEPQASLWAFPDHAWFNETTLAPRMSLTIDTSSVGPPGPPSSSSSATPTVRLRVDLNINLSPFESAGLDSEPPVAPPPSSAGSSDDDSSSSSSLDVSRTSSTGGESVAASSVEAADPGSPKDVPDHGAADPEGPKLPYPSLVKQYRDAGRAKRLKEELNILQFLTNDAAEILHQMLEIATDSAFHEYVWTQTSSTILETVTRFIDERNNPTRPPAGGGGGRGGANGGASGAGATSTHRPDEYVIEEFHVVCDASGHVTASSTSPEAAPSSSSVNNLISNYNLEVVYNDCWEIYRIMVMHVLEGKYIDICRDVLHLSRNELRVLMDAHTTLVRQEEERQGRPLTLIRDIISSTSHMLDPERRPRRPSDAADADADADADDAMILLPRPARRRRGRRRSGSADENAESKESTE